MGKNKKKNKKKKYKYSEGKFRHKICRNCLICSSTKNSFCYERYKEAPELFWKHSIPVLQSMNEWPEETQMGGFFSELDMFDAIFCKDVCQSKELDKVGNCKYLLDCFEAFEVQLEEDPMTQLAYAYSKKRVRKNNKKGNKKKNKKKPNIKVPTFFCNDDDVWKVRIDKVNADKNSEQDKDNKSAAAVKGSTD